MERRKRTAKMEAGPEIYSGYCPICKKDHRFPGTYDPSPANVLMAQFTEEEQLAEGLSLAPLFGDMRGKMFGVMTCLAGDGSLVNIKAFSGQFNGGWLAPGWVGPLFDVEKWNAVNAPAERVIKNLDQTIGTISGSKKKQLLVERRNRSRDLMKKLHALYRLTNFSGHIVSLADLFPLGRGIPTGTGDCCAPKLLNYAACHNLLPLSLSEFYWGRKNKSKTRRHGNFYSPCREKCGPILGFLLCGLEELYEQRT
jgi:hypothetical protein